MHVEIGTLTSKVNVGDGPAPNLELVEKIVAMVMARLKDEQATKERTREEQKIRPHMADPEPY